MGYVIYSTSRERNRNRETNIFLRDDEKNAKFVAEVPDFDLELPDIAMSSLEVAGVGSFANSGIWRKGPDWCVGVCLFLLYTTFQKQRSLEGSCFSFPTEMVYVLI